MGDLRSAALPRTLACGLVTVLGVTLFSADGSSLDRRRKAESLYSTGERVNANTVSVVSGNPNGTYLSIAYDLSAVLDDGDDLRILPVVGKGGGQNIRDVRFLKGIDIGITQYNLLSLFRRTNEIGPIDDKILYIARLFNEEMHVVVRADSGITSVQQLQGKKVNFSDLGSGTQLSTRDIFDRLGIKAIEVNMGQNDAAEALKTGKIAATVLIAGKPTGSTSRLKAADGFRILPVAFSKSLQDDYLPATLSHEDYPGLIEAGRTVDTVAVGAVLIAYNWEDNTERQKRVAKFVEAFFPRIAEFQHPPRHPKWRETNISAKVPGWKRLPAAEEWLSRAREQSLMRPRFDEFLAQSGVVAAATPVAERERLFREYLKWNEKRAHQ